MKKITLFAVFVLGFVTSFITLCKVYKTDSFSDTLNKRTSGYCFDKNKKVSEEQLKSLVKAAQLTPSSYNDQPWYFIICDKNTNSAAYDKAFNSLVEFNQKWAKDAPVLIVVLSSTNSREKEFNRWAQYDTGAAAFSIMLQATQLGLMTHQMGGFDEQKIAQSFSIPKDFVPMSVMAIGYDCKSEKPADKKRKKSEENFFWGNWDLK